MIDSTLKNANILIVDDQEANIDVLEGLLEMQGYTNVKSTTDPREVVLLFGDFKPDLILLDLTMPHLSGFEVMAQLKPIISVGAYLPILVLTADITVDAKLRALSDGASDFLTKPFDLIEVGLRIRNLLFTSYLQQQLRNQNQILEVKVKERTAELEEKNIELIAAKEKAEASDRLKTAFLQTISHEVRTPLNGILGFASLLATRDATIEEKLQYVDIMYYSSDRLIKTITDYVDMALIVSNNMDVNFESVDVIPILKEVKISYQKFCDDKNIQLNLLLPQDQEVLYIQTDPALLQNVISHLIDNAIKFTSKGNISIGLSVESSFVKFSVTDTGIGIEENDQERIFEKFMQGNFSVSRPFEGNGLGLSIIKGLLALLHGEVKLKSVIGEGSTFSITVPI